MEILKKLITSNNKGKAQANFPKYIVIHDTGNSNRTANAENHYNWLENNNGLDRSAHIFVDDHVAIQVIDFFTPAWHTGKLYVSKPQVIGVTNFNSVGIEFCINADGDLTRTLLNTVAVVKKLMVELDIPVDRVITHQMSSGKSCPSTFIKNMNLWSQFKKDLVTGSTNDEQIIKALKYLEQEKVINSVAYWQNQISKVDYLDGLILNMYARLKNERG